MASYVSTFPVVADVTAVLTAMGIKADDIAALNVQSALDDIESELEAMCGGEFLVAPGTIATVKRYNAPDGVVLPLRTPVASSSDLPLVEVQIARVDEPVLDLLEGVDYRLWPESAPGANLPYTGIVFEHSICVPRNGLLVSGAIGFGSRLSKAQFNAIVGGVIWKLYPVISARLATTGATAGGVIKAKQIGQLREEYTVAGEGKNATLKTEAPLLGERYEDFLLAITRKPLTA